MIEMLLVGLRKIFVINIHTSSIPLSKTQEQVFLRVENVKSQILVS